MLIFAYGSNMHLNRLRNRVPSVVKVCNAFLPGYTFSFNKRSGDGSEKGNMQQSNGANDIVWGVIFEIDESEKPALDRAEGLGYGYYETILNFTDENSNQVQAQVYIAEEDYIDNGLTPYDWYKEYVVIGAQQNGLPVDYVARIADAVFTIDTDAERRQRELNILRS